MTTERKPNAAQVATLDRIMSEGFAHCSIEAFYINDDGDYMLTLDDPTDEFEYVSVAIFPDGTWET